MYVKPEDFGCQSCQYNFPVPQNIDIILQQYLWLNSHIHVGGKPAINKKLYDTGIHRIIDIVQDGEFMSYQDLIQCYSNDIHFLEYLQLIKAIPKQWVEIVKLEQPSSVYGNR